MGYTTMTISHVLADFIHTHEFMSKTFSIWPYIVLLHNNLWFHCYTLQGCSAETQKLDWFSYWPTFLSFLQWFLCQHPITYMLDNLTYRMLFILSHQNASTCMPDWSRYQNNLARQVNKTDDQSGTHPHLQTLPLIVYHSHIGFVYCTKPCF